MKYKVTEKHGYLKLGLEINKHFEIGDELGNLYDHFDMEIINNWLKNGWIEEIQEPEFTKLDMISFAEYHDSGSPFSAKNMFNDWIKDTKR